MRNKLEIIKEFSKKDESGKRRYFVLRVCLCGNEFTSRKDGSAKSCGCINANKNTTRRTGKFIYSIDERANKAIMAAAREVYRFYKDGDISFDKFLELAKCFCYYCGSSPSNSLNQGLKKTGSLRYVKRANSNGDVVLRPAVYSDLGDKATFLYNGLDRKDQTQPHNLNNIVVCCKTCNFMKRKMSIEDFTNHIKRIYACLTIKPN